MKNIKKVLVIIVAAGFIVAGKQMVSAMLMPSNCARINAEPELKRVFDNAMAIGDVASVMWALREDLAQSKSKRVIAQDTMNLCDFKVAGSDTLFCQTNKGITRINMPQLSSNLEVGSPGYILFHGKDLNELHVTDPIIKDLVTENYNKDPKKLGIPLPVSREGGVDAAEYFKEYLRKHGKTITLTTIPAYKLQATQNELITEKINQMWWILKLGPCAPGYSFIVAPIFVSADNYVLDGHHRWASIVSSAFGIINIKKVMMEVFQVDEVIGDEDSGLVKMANDFTRQFGLTAQAG
jgi:hypothetical protein